MPETETDEMRKAAKRIASIVRENVAARDGLPEIMKPAALAAIATDVEAHVTQAMRWARTTLPA